MGFECGWSRFCRTPVDFHNTRPWRHSSVHHNSYECVTLLDHITSVIFFVGRIAQFQCLRYAFHSIFDFSIGRISVNFTVTLCLVSFSSLALFFLRCLDYSAIVPSVSMKNSEILVVHRIYKHIYAYSRTFCAV